MKPTAVVSGRSVFTATLFLSAFLLFLIQPMVGKLLLPLLGGAPAVWNTCMIFFQAVLLGGYLYAHVVSQRLRPRHQLMVHAAILAIGFLSLPIRIPPDWVPPTNSMPVGWLLTLLAVTTGLPFFVVSTSAPLLQRWFSTTRDPDAADPYFLYAASNLGSLVALLGYPFLIEPFLRLADQRMMWTIGYGLLALGVMACGLAMRRDAPEAPARASTPAEPLSVSRRVRWVLLAFTPSSLLLGLTTFLTTDVAPIPLLWVMPLAIYLLTFVLTFAKRPPIPHAWMVRAFPSIVVPMLILMPMPGLNLMALISLHTLLFFVATMVCHGELALDRPSSAHLTEFYLWLSVGGVLGGLFNGLLAPLIFKVPVEYALALVLACLLRPVAPEAGAPSSPRWLDYAFPAALAGLMVALMLTANAIQAMPASVYRLVVYLPIAMLCYAFRNRPMRFGLGVAAILLIGRFVTPEWQWTRHFDRSFFGAYRVLVSQGPDGAYHVLTHGSTVHGAQSIRPDRRRDPITYFHTKGPIADVFRTYEGRGVLDRVAVVGLGTGTLACYATPAQEWTFYEIDPAIEQVALDGSLFTFLRDCLERPTIVLGDARIALRGAPDGAYRLLIIDAFSSDAIPLHLLTREALALYVEKVASDGLIVLHVSNRHLELTPIIARTAGTLGLSSARKLWKTTRAEQELGLQSSSWVAISRAPDALDRLVEDAGWTRVTPDPTIHPWSDDYSNLVQAIMRKARRGE